MGASHGPKKVSAVFKAKQMVVKTALLALGVAFEMVSKGSRELQDEIEDWEEGRILKLGVLPDGPALSVRKEGGRLVYLGSGDYNAGLNIYFKNMDCAFMVLSGQIGADTGLLAQAGGVI